MSIHEEKNLLRNKIKIISNQLSAEYKKTASDNIFYNLVFSGILTGISSAFVYLSTESEPATDKIIEYLLNNGVEVFSPKCISTGVMKACKIENKANFSVNKYGIKEPDTSCTDRNHFDLIIIPCVTAAINGKRLGHGGGYYDRFLKDAQGIKVCLCFDKLLSDDIPADSNDINMDYLITETISLI